MDNSLFKEKMACAVTKHLVIPVGTVDIVWLSDHKEAADVQSITIELLEGAQATVQELFDHIHTDVIRTVDIIVHKNARLDYISEQRMNLNTSMYQVIRVAVKEGGWFEKRFSARGALRTTTAYEITLQGKNAHASVIGTVSLTDDQHHQYSMLQLHEEPHAYSNVVLKGVVDGKSFLEYQGTITIEKAATGSKAFQEHKNLIVSKHARVTSIPNLEVHTNAVQCGHGAAIAPIDEEHLFYLQARGMSYEQAKKLLIQGFLINVFLAS